MIEQQLIAENERLKKENAILSAGLRPWLQEIGRLKAEIARLNKLLSSYEMTSK